MASTLRNNTERNRYEQDIDGHTVFADYRYDGKVLVILHVEAPPSLRGTGAAGRFMQELMERMRSEGLSVKPVCGYAASWIDRHSEYHDLLQT